MSIINVGVVKGIVRKTSPKWPLNLLHVILKEKDVHRTMKYTVFKKGTPYTSFCKGYNGQLSSTFAVLLCVIPEFT